MKHGERAFPQPITHAGNTVDDEFGQGGMSLHDWFVGMAMGECIRQSFAVGQENPFEHIGTVMDRAAAWAEQAADAVERRQKQSKRETK